MRDIPQETILNNQNTICQLLSSINRPNANVNGLIDKLKSSDFFTAPASTKYHNCCRGGLAEHCINVYKNLKSLVELKGFEHLIDEDSIIICALLHDMSKMNFYEKTAKNKKVYSPQGSKYDDLGNFDWVSEMGYAVKPDNERFLYGNHEETSEFMVRQYIPLKLEESMAILHHHGGKGYDSTQMNLNPIFRTHPLIFLLHTADTLATFIDERDE